jgi:hypothetical protein
VATPAGPQDAAPAAELAVAKPQATPHHQQGRGFLSSPFLFFQMKSSVNDRSVIDANYLVTIDSGDTILGILFFASFSRNPNMFIGPAVYGSPFDDGLVPHSCPEVLLRLKIAYYVVTIAMLFSLSLTLERRAYAYVDPGSGLLMLQAAGTVFTGVLFTLRKRIKSLFTSNKSAETPAIEVISSESEA